MIRVVITGMGIWSCLGKNKEEVTQSLREGKSGIGIEEERLVYGYQSALTGLGASCTERIAPPPIACRFAGRG